MQSWNTSWPSTSSTTSSTCPSAASGSAIPSELLVLLWQTAEFALSLLLLVQSSNNRTLTSSMSFSDKTTWRPFLFCVVPVSFNSGMSFECVSFSFIELLTILFLLDVFVTVFFRDNLLSVGDRQWLNLLLLRFHPLLLLILFLVDSSLEWCTLELVSPLTTSLLVFPSASSESLAMANRSSFWSNFSWQSITFWVSICLSLQFSCDLSGWTGTGKVGPEATTALSASSGFGNFSLSCTFSCKDSFCSSMQGLEVVTGVAPLSFPLPSLGDCSKRCTAALWTVTEGDAIFPVTLATDGSRVSGTAVDGKISVWFSFSPDCADNKLLELLLWVWTSSTGDKGSCFTLTTGTSSE